MPAEEIRSEAEAAAPVYAIREPFDSPYSWLAAGWRDMWRVPCVSLTYGAIFAVAGLLLAVGLTRVGLQSLILVLAGGFILVGPMLAAGLYEASRRLEKSEPVSLASTLRAGFFGRGQLVYMGLLYAGFGHDRNGRVLSLMTVEPALARLCNRDARIYGREVAAVAVDVVAGDIALSTARGRIEALVGDGRALAQQRRNGIVISPLAVEYF
jgi:hypothetical protein